MCTRNVQKITKRYFILHMAWESKCYFKFWYQETCECDKKSNLEICTVLQVLIK